MKLGKFKTSVLVLFIYLFFTPFSFGEEKIVTVPLINLENLEPSFEEENSEDSAVLKNENFVLKEKNKLDFYLYTHLMTEFYLKELQINFLEKLFII